MIVTLDDNRLPQPKKISIKNSDAIALARGLNGELNGDRSYEKEEYILEYDFFDVEYWAIIKALYKAQFETGTFFRLQVTDTDQPINTPVYISPMSVNPAFSGQTQRDFDLVLIQR